MSELFLAGRGAQLRSRSALFSQRLLLSRLMKQLAGDDALLPFCSFNSTTMLLCQDEPLCSFNKPGATTHGFPHIGLSELRKGRFSWQRGACSSWRKKPIHQQEYCLPTKPINKNWSKSPPKNGSSSQKGDNVADTGLIPPRWYKQCCMLSSEHRGESCSDPHKSNSFPYPWQPLLSHTQRMMKISSAKWCCHRSDQFNHLLV